jgi:prevent-host-death family protein
VQTKITATELARNLSDILNRVRYKGEQFIVERNGEPVATLGPPAPGQELTVADFLRRLGTLEWPDEDFASDLEEVQVQANQLRVEPPDWPP